jgi:benzodiazapine receptor
MRTGRFGTVLGLVVSLVVCFGAGWIGSRFQPGEWYAQLAKPSWNPPNWLFGPVWSALYLMMAVAAWLVWKRHGFRRAAVPLAAFVVQLVLNAAWTWLFFGMQQPGVAFAEIVVLWLAIAVTLVLFWKRNALAGALMAPYLAWVTFAAALNYALWRLNVS